MRSLIKLLAVLAICVLGIGFYRGWFHLSGPNPGGGDKVDVNMTVDKGKMKSDVNKAEQKVEKAGQKVIKDLQGTGQAK